MKIYSLLLPLFISHVQSSYLDVWHEQLYSLAESFETFSVAIPADACHDMLSLELKIAQQAKTRERYLRDEALSKPHLRVYPRTSQFNLLRKQCFDEALFCGYGIFLYYAASHGDDYLEKFLMRHAVNCATLGTTEQLRAALIDRIKVEQLKLFHIIGNNGADVQFGPDYLLAWAAWCGSLDIVQLLMPQADIANYGYYAIEAAIISINNDYANIDDVYKILHFLILQGAQVTRKAYDLVLKKCAPNDKIIALLLQHISLKSVCVIM